MKSRFPRSRRLRWCLAGAMLTIGGCGLTDLQLQQVLQSVLTSGLTTILTQAGSAVIGAATDTTQTDGG